MTTPDQRKNLIRKLLKGIELHLSLAALLTTRRKSLGHTQTEVADLIRTLLALGVKRKQVGRAIGATASA